MAKQNLAELKQRIELMKQFYYKGFGNAIAHIGDDAEYFVSHSGERNKTKKHMLTLFSEIEDYYDKIPFDGLNNNTDFAPLFVVRKLLPKFKKRVDNILENPEEGELKRLQHLSSAIVNVGEIYRWDIQNLIQEVKKTDKNYEVQVNDNKGRIYYL